MTGLDGSDITPDEEVNETKVIDTVNEWVLYLKLEKELNTQLWIWHNKYGNLNGLERINLREYLLNQGIERPNWLARLSVNKAENIEEKEDNKKVIKENKSKKKGKELVV